MHVVGIFLEPLDDSKRLDSEMSERTWQNPYCETPETSLPPSRRLSLTRLGELNRPRWGSVWGQESGRTDPPPPSWLERGLSRLGNSSQVRRVLRIFKHLNIKIYKHLNI